MRHAIIKKGTTDGIRAYALECRLSETFMDVPQLSVKVSSPSVIDFEIGDYIVFGYNGVTYTLRETPKKSKNARPQSYGGAFVYNLIFYGPEWDLRNAPFRDLVEADNVQHFTSMPDVTTYEDVYGIAARVQACMDDMYPGKWSIRVVSGLSSGSALAQRLSETQDFSLSDGKCLHALSQVYSQWRVSFVYSYEDGVHVITIGGVETQEDTSGLFMYGKGNGLKVIKASVQNASELATRLFVYGGTQNMQPRYYNGRTMEPVYIHSSDASNPTVTAICSGRKLLGDNMYVPNLMIPVSKWGKTKWYVWTASSHSQEVFTEVRNPSAGSGYAFDEPNIGSSRNVISSVTSDSIVVEGITYQYMTEVLYPDIRKAYIDAPQSYLDKYGIRPATVRFDGSGEREDIHPSIKGLTIGDIRAGLGSEAEYYPSTSVYTDPDGRVDKVLSCDNPQDDGLTSNGANKYDSVLTASIGQTTKSIDLSVEETEEDDPQYGTIIRKTYVADNVTILSKAFAVSTSSKGILHFAFPLRLAAGMRGLWHIRARVVVYREDSSGGKNEIVSYEKYVHGSGENGEINLTPTAADVGGGQYSINAEETLYIDVIILSIRAEYDEEVQPSYSIVIPAYTQQWRFAISLGAEFYIKLKQIGFDISDVPTNDGESPVISMTSGQCGGYEFEIHDVAYNSSDDSWTLRCARVQDSVLGQWFPNSIFRIEPDDTFVLLNIALPEVYITANEQRLYDAALAEGLYEERPLLEPEIDSKVMAESSQVLRAGMWFQVKDTDLGLTGADGGSFLILIDGVEVTDKPDSIRSFKVTLRNNKEDNVFVRMQRQIAQTSASMQSERRSQTKTSVSETPTKGGGGDGYIDTSDFVTLSTDQTITGRKTFATDVIFGGAVSEGVFGSMFVPSTEGPGIYGLLVSDEPVQGEVPSGSGGLDKAELWEELGGTPENPVIGKAHLPGDTVYTDDLAGYALKSELPDLTPYATREWVTGQGYATQAWVKGLGYLTATDADEKYVNIAGDTMTGPLHGTNIELSGHISAATLYVPYSGGNKVYSLSVSDTPVQGEAPSGSGGLDSAALWEELGGNATDKVIGLSRIPDIPVDMVSGLLGGDSRILPSLLPDWLMGQLLYGGTVDGSSVATVSAAFKDRYGTGGDTVTLNASNAAQYEGVYFIASADASSGVVQSLGVRTGDWVVSNGIEWTKIDNTDSVSSVAGLTGVIGKAALQTALSDSTHRFVTDAQIASWDGKWAWNADEIKAVKVDAAVLADKAKALNAARSLWGQSFDGTGDVDGDMSGVGGITMSGSIAGAVNADFSGYLSAGTLYVPYSGGNKVYSLKVSDAPVSGEAPSGGGGMDTDALWLELGGSTDDKVIAKSHLPEDTVYEGDLAGYALKSEIPSLTGYATQSWVQSQGYLKSVSLATISDLNSGWDALLKAAPSVYVTRWPTASEVGALTQTAADDRYLRLTGGTLTGMLKGTDIELSGHIKAADFTGAYLSDNATNYFVGDAASGAGSSKTGLLLFAYGNRNIYLYTNSEQRMVVNASGNVGIGTTSPAYKLDVAGTLRATDGAYVKTLTISSTGGEGHLMFSRTAYNYISTPANGHIAFVTNGVDTSAATSELTIFNKQIFPGTTNAVLLGASSNRWSNVYSVLGNFSGAVSMGGTLSVSGTATVGNLIATGKLFIPSTAGNNVYSLSVSDSPVSGESPSAGGGGLDVDAMWDELEASDASRVIDASHIPLLDMEKVSGLPMALSVVNASLNAMSEALQDKADISDIPSLSGYVSSVTTSGTGNAVTGYAKSGNTLTLVKGTTFLTSVPKATSSAYGGIKIGYPESGKNYPVELDSSGRAYVSVPWVNTTYSLSSFGITATAAEINKLDGIGTLLHSGNYTSYTVTKTGGGASGTWPISITGNSATSTKLALQDTRSVNTAPFAYGLGLVYLFKYNTADGLSDGGTYHSVLQFDQWTDSTGGLCKQLALTDGGNMWFRNASSATAWGAWKKLLDSSNYAATLDTRYVKKAGDTMTGRLTVDGTSTGNALDLVSENATETYLRVYMGASYKAAIGYHTTHGAYLYNRFTDTYLGLRNNGLAYRDGYVMWDAGNDGSGSGLDADLLDGYQANDLMILGRSVNMLSGSTYSGYIPPLVLAMMRGAEQIENPTFLNGSNLAIYNNASDGSVTHTRVTDTTAGNGSGYVLKIHSSASASPGGGGFTFQTSKAYGQTTCVFRAKIPVGYTIDFETNDVGGGGLNGQWLTERTGTGKWEWYACTVYFGSSPLTSHFYYLTPAANVDWYLAYAQVFYNSEALYVGMQAQKADRLTTSHTIWGQSFNGTGNVSGDMTGVGNLTASGIISSYNVSSTYIANSSTFYCGNAKTYLGGDVEGACLGSYNNLPIYIYSAGIRAVFNPDGNVGIGTTSPSYKLDVAGTLRATGRITAAGLTSSASIVANAGLSTTTLSASGAATLSSTLSVSGAATLKNGLTVTGTVTASGNIIAYSSSSRLVKDILPKHTTFSQRLTALGRVVDYRYNNVLKRDRDAHIGLIYENVRDAMHGMCHTHEGYGALNYLNTDYINLVAGAVQEHTDEITRLKNRVAALESEVTRLKSGRTAA